MRRRKVAAAATVCAGLALGAGALASAAHQAHFTSAPASVAPAHNLAARVSDREPNPLDMSTKAAENPDASQTPEPTKTQEASDSQEATETPDATETPEAQDAEQSDGRGKTARDEHATNKGRNGSDNHDGSGGNSGE